MLEDAQAPTRRLERMPSPPDAPAPTIGAAMTGQCWFGWVRCPACRSTSSIDLRRLDRHPEAAMTSLMPALSYRSCPPARRSPNLCGCPGPASPTRCGSSTRDACLARSGSDVTPVLHQKTDFVSHRGKCCDGPIACGNRLSPIGHIAVTDWCHVSVYH